VYAVCELSGWIQKRLVLDAVVLSLLAYRQGETDAMDQLELFLRSVLGAAASARVMGVVRGAMDEPIPVVVERVSKVLNGRWAR